MSLIPFLIAAGVLAITPGPGMAYVVARTVAGGRSEGLASCLGTGLGGLLHVLAVALGLSLVIAQSAWVFHLLKYVGAAFLSYLGVRMLLRKEPAVATEDVMAVVATHQVMKSGEVRAARARLMTRVSGVTMLGLGVFLALATHTAVRR